MPKRKSIIHKKHGHINLIFIGLSIIIAIFLSRLDAFHIFLMQLGNFGYLGAFVAGILFVSTFTMATGSLILLILSKSLSPMEIGLVAGLGAVVGDFVILRFVKDDLLDEISEIYHHIGGKHLSRLFHTKYFRWTLPVIGAIIIVSPLPDELGVTLLGISKMSTIRFVLVSYLLNTLGIFLIITASLLFKS
jgi:hypothetical protein